MALGFLVQKFDLFLRVAASSLAARPLTPRSQIVGDIAGLLPHRWLSQCSTQSTTYLLRADLLPCTPVGVVPLSTGSQPHPPIVIATPSAGPNSVAVCDQVRSVDKRRLTRNQGQLFCGGFAVYREWAASCPGTVKVRASRADASRPWVATQGRAPLAEPVKTSDFGNYKGGKAQRRARKIADRVDRGRASCETAAFAASSG
jgi:hypothetical protein